MSVASQVTLQRIYLHDASFESPQSPNVFLKEWKPQVEMDLKVRHHTLDDAYYEVMLWVSATAKLEESIAFVAEIQQAGVFALKGVKDESLEHALNVFCPTILFPYAREALDSIIVKGSFPALLLAPVNFEALYQQRLVNRPVQGHA